MRKPRALALKLSLVYLTKPLMYYQFIHFYLLGLLATLMTPRRTVSPYTLASTTTDENALPMKINRSLSKLISHSQGKIHTGHDLKATLGIGGKGFGGPFAWLRSWKNGSKIHSSEKTLLKNEWRLHRKLFLENFE